MYAFVAERRLQRWFTGEKHIKIIKRPQSRGCGFHISFLAFIYLCPPVSAFVKEIRMRIDLPKNVENIIEKLD